MFWQNYKTQNEKTVAFQRQHTVMVDLSLKGKIANYFPSLSGSFFFFFFSVQKILLVITFGGPTLQKGPADNTSLGHDPSPEGNASKMRTGGDF